MKIKLGLCTRCEHRAIYFETGLSTRYECASFKQSVYACYMYKPVLPVIISPLDKRDRRPRFAGAMISSREKFERVAKGKLKGRKINKEEAVLYWTNLK